MSVWRLGSAWDDEEKLAEHWRGAVPFPHLVIDELLPTESLSAGRARVRALDELLAMVDEEPIEL